MLGTSAYLLPAVLMLLMTSVLVTATAGPDDEWSWGTVDGRPSSKTPTQATSARNQRTGRQNSGRMVFIDRDAKGRNPRVNLETRFDSHEPENTFTVSSAPIRSHRVHSVQTVDTPVYQPRPIVISNSGSDEGSTVEVPIYSPQTPEVVNVPISVSVDTSNRGHRKIERTEPAESEGRFLDIDKKLCKMGIGWNCGKKGGGGGYVNLDNVPYLPQPIYPPQYSAAPQSPLPYGGGIQSSDVFHVQPVALQPVGGPIQAIPLGPSGGQVPHGPGLSLPSYGAPQYPQPPFQYEPQIPNIPYAAPHHNVPQLQNSYQSPQESFQVIHEAPGKQFSHEKQVVQHIHQHTHIYKDGKPVDSYYSNSVNRPPRGHRLPVVAPHPNTLDYSADYREACECVASFRCASFDIVGSKQSLFGLLDARNNKKTEDLIYSNNTVSEEALITTTKAPLKRTKRDTKKRQTNSFLRAEEGRISTGYSPGPSGCRLGDVCCRNPARSDNTGPKTFSCGRRNNAGVVGRVKTPYNEPGDTDFGEYPWQAAILKRDGHDMVYVCGGSLVDDRHIVTAAHCVNKLKGLDLQVRLGEWDVGNEDEFYPNVDFSVDDVIVHPSFYAGMLHNDIAILKLDRFVDFNRYPHISPVCLPEPHSHFDGRVCHVTGWGKDAFGKVGNFQQVLKRVEVPMVRKSTCENSLQDTRLGRGFRLHDGMSCAGGEEGKDACKGDGGGPLVCKGKAGEYQLAGVVSWGIGCGERGIPGVYVDVPHYVDWIYENTRF